jgi:hypothetical protein
LGKPARNDRQIVAGAAQKRLEKMRTYRVANHPYPKPDYPAPVEGLLFLQSVAYEARRKGQRFDKLSLD